MGPHYPEGLKGDIARLLSPEGTHGGKPSLGKAIQRAITRPGPLAILLYRLAHRLWQRGWQTPAEIIWRLNLFLTGADIHPGAEIAGGLRLTHTSGLVIGRDVRIETNVTLLHGVTLGGSSRGFFDEGFTDGFPTIREGTKIAAGAAVLGPVTVGKGCFIGANAVVGKDLPDGTVYTPGRQVSELGRRIEALEAELADLKSRLAEHEAEPVSHPGD
ncbi:MAG: hypothetical protein M3198_08275 [Actinomycetota bacterium]|nr:hypothetical protein [Actinomycetota bacterium]